MKNENIFLVLLYFHDGIQKIISVIIFLKELICGLDCDPF